MVNRLGKRSAFTMMPMNFAEKVIKLREARGWKQSDLRKAIGDISPTTVSNWESGSIPAMDIALKVARALGVPLDYLADDEQDRPVPTAMSEAEQQLWAMAKRHGAERILKRLEEVGVGPRNRDPEIVESAEDVDPRDYMNAPKNDPRWRKS